jgi:hypothetical protein
MFKVTTRMEPELGVGQGQEPKNIVSRGQKKQKTKKKKNLINVFFFYIIILFFFFSLGCKEGYDLHWPP